MGAWEVVRKAFGYDMPGTDTGHYSCRHILNDDSKPWSEHAWRGAAFDMNWLQNPWTTGDEVATDMPQGMTDAIQRIRTHSGEFVFRWGGDWDRDPDTPHTTYDAIHFSVVAHPDDLATGIDWSTVLGEEDELAILSDEAQEFWEGAYRHGQEATHPTAGTYPVQESSLKHIVENDRFAAQALGVSAADESGLFNALIAVTDRLTALEEKFEQFDTALDNAL